MAPLLFLILPVTKKRKGDPLFTPPSPFSGSTSGFYTVSPDRILMPPARAALSLSYF